ncbi:oligopeptide transport system permease protein [Streptomyces sp. 2224.1]|uniref:ABC transporter permease n=1 Tax=unclassified Streptomyces TaxID=2593676 RepID=UPI00087F6929|nr:MULTISPECIES: ABC transporter permease [unclassified Streptomyces]PBC84856.1 oligopeptide transport system permease protein [Streptomyces sp. 2321.6]SDR25592.1 oligopeptide transport system permease protein [Streptomyces sp. KS_16]SEB60211.1 oligopeptide transport system permease protein [Streptomyces sp. 2224.1]SED47065.1 oligopeptide transport system permease protein [Streptomyces sp. 2133.1]SEE39145.1 oligopeptide transport system permease protein [Streptomyces sp. 2112.3]
MPEPYVPKEAIGHGDGGSAALAIGEAESLERRPGAAPPSAGPPGKEPGKPRSLWSDAWHDLYRNPVFVLSALVIVFLVIIAIWPQLIATGNPYRADLAKAQQGSQPGHPFGFDTQGRDVYTRVVYGARASITVGVCATTGAALLGSLLGGLAGFFGGWGDNLLSRLADIFFGIPVILGGLVFLSVVTSSTVWPVVGFIVLLGWPQVSRIARGSVVTAKQNDYVQAARALGAGNGRMLLRHIAPNAVAPVIVVATIALGTYIALEATLSYLGAGLKPPTVSWGIDISTASTYIRSAPHMLLWPAGALSITVLAFIMLGDAVRDALDPKLR